MTTDKNRRCINQTGLFNPSFMSAQFFLHINSHRRQHLVGITRLSFIPLFKQPPCRLGSTVCIVGYNSAIYFFKFF